MTPYSKDEQRHCLDTEQKKDARQALGCGVPVRQVAVHFGLSEITLRRELGMPMRKPEQADQKRSLFDESRGDS